jgi:4,5-dihydroxyphthalate decarboxylase
MNAKPSITLSVALGDYPHTLRLMRGDIDAPGIKFNFTDIRPANRFFKPMVRELKFDVSEMAIATYLQAKAHGKPLVLLPATMMGRFQHGAMLYNAEHGTIRPGDLPGRRIGVRAYSQTTAVWLRGILTNDYGVDLDRAHWVTFEDGHVAEYREPPGTERVAADKNLLHMLRAGEIDAAIYGGDMPNEPWLTSVIPDPDGAAQRWYAKYRAVPINHMVVVKESLAKSNPDAVREVYRLLLQGKKAAGAPRGGIDFIPFGVEACRPGLELIVDYAVQQKLIPRRLAHDELYDETTRSLGG